MKRKIKRWWTWLALYEYVPMPILSRWVDWRERRAGRPDWEAKDRRKRMRVVR